MPHGVFSQGPGVLAGTLLFEEHATPLASLLILQQKNGHLCAGAQSVFSEKTKDTYIFFLFLFQFIINTP